MDIAGLYLLGVLIAVIAMVVKIGILYAMFKATVWAIKHLREHKHDLQKRKE